MKSEIRKAILPVAGLGTRMLPATKAIPKEMLPIVDKPLIQYVVDEAVAAGIKEIVLVTHASKDSIENHFDTSFELEAQLERRVKRQLLDEVRSIIPDDVTIISIRQAEARGLGHAIACARPVVGDQPFAILLPDVMIDQYDCNPEADNLAVMLDNYTRTGISQVMVEPVAWEKVHQYGVVDCNGVELTTGKTAQITGIVEKPSADRAPSNLAVVGRYVLSPAIWDLLAKAQPESGGEIQLTDAIDQLLKLEVVEAYHIVGHAHDCGTKLGFLRANIAYALRHDEVGSQLRDEISKELKKAEDCNVAKKFNPGLES